MAKDRAKDPKRVPSLGIGEPISHVNEIAPGWADSARNRKFDSNWNTDEERKTIARSDDAKTARINAGARQTGKTKVIKIDSSK